MAYNYLSVFRNESFQSENTVRENTTNDLVDKTCVFIHLETEKITDKSQSLMDDCEERSAKNAKFMELIKTLEEEDKLTKFVPQLGVIYLKKEQDSVYAKIHLNSKFLDFIRKNFSEPVLLVEGTLILGGNSNVGSSPMTRSIHKSYKIKEENNSLTLTTPFPFELVQPVKECSYVVQSFSLAIGWEEETWLGGNLKLNPNHLLANLYGNVSDKHSPPKDFVLVAGNGAELSCHGLILASQSPALAAMVKPNGSTMESESKRIELTAFTEDSLASFLSYIYCENVSFKEMKCGTALELFRLGHMYQLPGLAENLSKLMMQKGEEWFTPNCILELYYLLRNLPEFKELASHAVDIMLKLPDDDMRQCERYQELEMKEVVQLLWIFLKKLKSN